MMRGAILTMAAVLTGCGTYDANFEYLPRPAEAEPLKSAESGDTRVRALATIVGIRRHDHEIEYPATVEVLVRVENLSSATIVLDTASLKMLTGNLKPLGQPAAVPSGRLELAPSQTQTVRAYFPFPDGDYDEGQYDLRGLNVSWSIQDGGRQVAQSVSFHRQIRRYSHDDYDGPRFHFGVGYIRHR